MARSEVVFAIEYAFENAVCLLRVPYVIPITT
jgi:hypothetical protein